VYSLIKHANFTLHDMYLMTGEERGEFMNLLIDESNREKEAIESAKSSK